MTFDIIFPTWHSRALAYSIVLLLSLIAKLGFWVSFFWQRGSSHVPGPWLARWSRFWLIRVLASGDSAQKFAEVNKTYGKSFATGIP